MQISVHSFLSNVDSELKVYSKRKKFKKMEGWLIMSGIEGGQNFMLSMYISH